MTDTKHTPGPWRVGDRKPYVEVWGPMRMNSHPILASMESEPREANARLMAASPKMLASAQEIDGLSLVIESAVRTADPERYEAVLAALKTNRAAIALATSPHRIGEG